MWNCRKNDAATALAVLSLLLIGSAAQAQVRNYDTVYPMGAPYTINERSGAVIPGEQPTMLLKGHTKKHYRQDDNVYGKMIQLDVGMGGAHFVN